MPLSPTGDLEDGRVGLVLDVAAPAPNGGGWPAALSSCVSIPRNILAGLGRFWSRSWRDTTRLCAQWFPDVWVFVLTISAIAMAVFIVTFSDDIRAYPPEEQLSPAVVEEKRWKELWKAIFTGLCVVFLVLLSIVCFCSILRKGARSRKLLAATVALILVVAFVALLSFLLQSAGMAEDAKSFLPGVVALALFFSWATCVGFLAIFFPHLWEVRPEAHGYQPVATHPRISEEQVEEFEFQPTPAPPMPAQPVQNSRTATQLSGALGASSGLMGRSNLQGGSNTGRDTEAANDRNGNNTSTAQHARRRSSMGSNFVGPLSPTNPSPDTSDHFEPTPVFGGSRPRGGKQALS